MNTAHIALVGYGNVARAFARMLERQRDGIRSVYGVEPIITAIVTGSHGGVVDPRGIDVTHLSDDQFDMGIDAAAVIEAGKYDVMVELTPTNAMSGQPATDHIRHALERGKHVITANKGPLAWAYRELRDLAAEKGVAFLFESTVMNGTPVFNMARETLMGCRIIEVRGILNATTNFVLARMEQGASLEEALEEGGCQGFVEADPSLDLDGWDPATKLSVLMNVLMDAHVTPLDIQRTGIRGVTRDDLDAAARAGKRVKLVCHGWLDDAGQPVGTVEPTLVDASDIASLVNGTMQFVTINADIIGETTIVEHTFKPEIDRTAFGVMSDLLRILK